MLSSTCSVATSVYLLFPIDVFASDFNIENRKPEFLFDNVTCAILTMTSTFLVKEWIRLTPSPLNVHLTLSRKEVNMSTASNETHNVAKVYYPFWKKNYSGCNLYKIHTNCKYFFFGKQVVKEGFSLLCFSVNVCIHQQKWYANPRRIVWRNDNLVTNSNRGT